jgi:hypothetical protein
LRFRKTPAEADSAVADSVAVVTVVVKEEGTVAVVTAVAGWAVTVVVVTAAVAMAAVAVAVAAMVEVAMAVVAMAVAAMVVVAMVVVEKVEDLEVVTKFDLLNIRCRKFDCVEDQLDHKEQKPTCSPERFANSSENR